MKSRRKFINKLHAFSPSIVTPPSSQMNTLNMSQSHLIEPCLEEEMIELFDADAYLQDYPDVRNAFTSTKPKMMGKSANINPLQIFNHYLQYGRNEGRTAYCIRQNGKKVLYDGFNFEAYNRVCESGYHSHVNNELNGYIHYLNTIKTNPKPLLLHVKSSVNVFPEPLKNQGFIAMLQRGWANFDAWKYKKAHGKNGSAKELFIDYVSSNFESLMAPIKEAERNIVHNNHKICDKICVIHCGNIEVFKEIVYDYPVIKQMKLIVTYDKDVYYDNILKLNLQILHVINVQNKGMDCGPFLLSLKYLLANPQLYNNNTIFIKIHTKTIKSWRNKLIGNIIDFNNVELLQDKPVIFGSLEYMIDNRKGVNGSYIKKIIERNDNECIKKYTNYIDTYYDNTTSNHNKINPFTDLYPSEIFYKKYEPDLCNENFSHWFDNGINEFHRKSNVNYIDRCAKLKSSIIAGTMFGFNIHYINLFQKYNLEFEYSILEEGYHKNTNVTKLHAWEYYFSSIILINGGIIYGINKLENTISKCNDNIQMESIPKYSVINQPYTKSKIAFFMIVPGEIPDSGGYRTLLKYISYLNDLGQSIDLYFGIAWNDMEVELNTSVLDKYGMPICNNWLNHDNLKIEQLIKNLENYNEIDPSKNNFYLGLKCQRHYDVIVANAWQIAGAVYKNKESANKLAYIIQDREELFYPNEIELQQNVLKTYHNDFHYYCITQYLSNYFKNTYNFKNITSSYMGVNLQNYFNKKLNRSLNGVIIPYYADAKPGRKPELVEKIINILSQNNYKCFVYPRPYNKVTNNNIINLGTLNEGQLNQLYNENTVGIVFSDTNPSRLGFEMYASGLHVIEYESEFTKYDMPDNIFTKIKDERDIVNIVKGLANKKYDDLFLKNIDMNYDKQKLLQFMTNLLK